MTIYIFENTLKEIVELILKLLSEKSWNRTEQCWKFECEFLSTDYEKENEGKDVEKDS